MPRSQDVAAAACRASRRESVHRSHTPEHTACDISRYHTAVDMPGPDCACAGWVSRPNANAARSREPDTQEGPPLPHVAGLESRVVVAGSFSSSSRCARASYQPASRAHSRLKGPFPAAAPSLQAHAQRLLGTRTAPGAAASTALHPFVMGNGDS